MIPETKARRRRWLLVLALTLTIPLLLAACGGGDEDEVAEETAPTEEEAAEPVETVKLRLLSFLPEDNLYSEAAIPRWIELVQEESNGSIEIDYVGGPESIPTEEQFDAVANKLVDVAFLVTTFYVNQVPAGNTLHLSPFTPEEERDNGFFDFVDRIHREGGVAYLGRWIGASPFFIWSNKAVNTLDALKGQRMRSTSTYQHIFEALGVSPVSIVPPEVFTAVERGLIDGYGFPVLVVRDFGLLEVTKFIMNEPFYNQNGAIVINPGTLDSLSDDQKAALESATTKLEGEVSDRYLDLNREEWEGMQDFVEVVGLPEEESDRFVNLWYEETWDALVRTWGASTEDIDEAKRLLRFEEFTGNPDRIREIPCAQAAEKAADEPFCSVGR